MAVRDPRRKTIALDFDGVLSTVDSEAAEVLRRLRAKHHLVVFTARRDHDWVRGQLGELWRYFDEITSEKGRFDLLVDDMPLVHFTGPESWAEVERAAAELER